MFLEADLSLKGGLFFVGHVAEDRVENINGSNAQAGGAALYAAIAATTLSEDVSLVSAIGKDYQYRDVLTLFPRRYIRIFDGPSTKFEIRYDKRWEASYQLADYGPGPRISSSLIPFGELTSDSIVHISPLPPARVEKIAESVRRSSPETKISINTWIGYMQKRKDKKILKDLAAEVDFFIINDSEAKALTETETLSTALRLFNAKMLVVTLGEFGAIVNRMNSEIHMIPALRFPIEKVVDTTGAGDSWCGAFVAAYKRTEDVVKSVAAASLISSIKCTGWGFSKLLNLRFKSIDNIADYVIGLKEGGLQKKISDYYQ